MAYPYSQNNRDQVYARDGSSLTYCVEAGGGAASGWSVTYDSATGGTQDPIKAVCAC